MKKRAWFIAAALIAGSSSATFAVVFLNEVNHNPPGSLDDTREFIELCGTPGKKLDGYAIAFLNGSEQKFYARNSIPPIPNPGPEIDEFFSLDGLRLGKNGLLVLAISARDDYSEALDDTTFVEFWVDLWNGQLDVPGKLQNDGSNTIILMRNRPGRTQSDPANPGGLRWGKSVFHDLNLIRNVIDPQTNQLMDQFGDGSVDQGQPNGLSGNNLDLRGSKTPDTVADDLEIVDELSYEHTRGWEYDFDDRHVDLGSNSSGLPERRVHALDDSQGFNSDGLSRVDYRTKGAGWPATSGATGELPNGRNWQDTATEQWIRGETLYTLDANGFGIYYDNSANIGTGSIQPYFTNVPRWLSDAQSPDYSFIDYSYRLMAGRVNPLAVPFIPGDADRDGDCDADDIAKIAAVFGHENWVFSNSFSSSPEGDSGDPATQTRPWDVDATGDNGVEASDLQWTLNFQGDVTGRVVGVRYDSPAPSAAGVVLNPRDAIQCAVSLTPSIPTGHLLTQLSVGETVLVTVLGRVSAGALSAPVQQANGIMQFLQDFELSAPGVLRVETVEAIAPFVFTNGALMSYQGTSGDRGVRRVNGYTTNFQVGVAGATPMFRVRLKAIGLGTTNMLVRPAIVAGFAASTPQGLKVGHTNENGNPAASQYPSALIATVTSSAPALGNCDGDPTIDLVDYSCFFECMNGPDLDDGPNCALFDLNTDGHVDLRDFFSLQSFFGPD